MQQRLTSLLRHAAAWAGSKSVRQPTATGLQAAALPAVDHPADSLPAMGIRLIWTIQAMQHVSVSRQEVRTSDVPLKCLRV